MTPRRLVERPAHLHVPAGALARQLLAGVPSYLRTDIVRAAVMRPDGPAGLVRSLCRWRRWGFSPAFLAENAAAGHPARTALVDDVSALSYAELSDAARRLAAVFVALGVGPGGRVGLVARNSRVPVLTLLACALAGAVPMVMNPGASAHQLRRTAGDYLAQIVVADVDYAEAFRGAGVPVVLGFGSEDGVPERFAGEEFGPGGARGYRQAIAAVDRAAADAALPKRPGRPPTVIMSSGTSGRPKGVVRAVPKSPQVIGSIFPKVPWRTGGVVQLTASLFHAWGWLNLNLVLATSSTMVLRRHFDAEQAVADLVAHRVTGIASSAVFLRNVAAAFDRLPEATARRVAGDVEFIVSSGNALPPRLIAELNARFGEVTCNFYGSTEHGPVAVASAAELAADPDRAGTVAPGVRVAVLDGAGRPVRTGEVGTIFSANSESMAGYLSAADHVRVVDGLLSTGDLGFFDAQGFLHVRGRADDMVIKGGENVYPRELEEYLTTLDGVGDVFVKGVRGEIVSQLNCYIVRADSEQGRALDDAAVVAAVRANLAEHNVPDAIVWVDQLPRNDAGKVVPRQLPEP